MSLRDVTDRQAVLDAMSEFDRLGADAFTKKYGFRRSISYFVEHGDKLYDSKPLIAAAHGYQHGDPLPNNFSGGERHAAQVLKALGFTVTAPVERLPHWTRDELILALEAYLARRGQGGWSKTTVAI